MYRFPRTLAIKFIEEISEFVDLEIYDEDERKIPLHIEVLSVLNFFATGSYQRQVGSHAYNCVCQSCISEFIHKICRITVEHLGPKYVKFPTTEEEAIEVKDKFFVQTRLPGIVGLIDGTHVNMVNIPREEEYIYVNRKGNYSLNVQIISDAEMNILHVDARFPGSCHDSHIFESSTPLFLMENLVATNPLNWLIGDSAYSSRPYMITPIRNSSNQREEQFNIVHQRIRNPVERLFGKLKGRFRCISKSRPLDYSHEATAYIVYAVCISHNFLMKNGYSINEDDSTDEESEAEEEIQEEVQVQDDPREYLINYIAEHNI